MTLITANTQTHSITANAVVSPTGTVEFLGHEWYLPGAEPGWEIEITTLRPANQYIPCHPILADAPTIELEAEWFARISQDIEPHDTPLAIAKRLYDGFLDSPYFSTFSKIEGHAFRLNPNNTL